MKFSVAVVALAGALVLGHAPAALAMTESCQNDLNKVAQERLDAIKRLQGNGKRPTATKACAGFGGLIAAENKMLKWMEDNKEWCQIPEALIDDLKKANAQAVKVRGQACTVAKKEAQMRAQAAAGGGGAARRPAVKLPQGAL